MSRLGKKPIEIPKGVEVKMTDNVVVVKGPKGELKREFKTEIVGIEIKEEGVELKPKLDSIFANSLWGTYASHIANMVMGVTEGFTKKLIIEGVGFKAAVKGKTLDMALGFSHPVIVDIPEGLEVLVEKNNVTISGIDKEMVGSFAALVRAKKKPEPYKGKGIRYHDEVIIRKQGKKTV